MGSHITKPSNKSMVDRLVERSCYIHSQNVEGVFRAVDRAMYFDIEEGEPIDPYEDDPWRRGNLHLSAPCIYAKVVEALDLRPGLSFLNLGSGTGYLNTIVGLLVGPNGINHGVEIHADVVEYAYNRLQQFRQKSYAIDKYDFSEPIFVTGNCLNLNPNLKYDRIYLGAACLPNMELFMKKLVTPNGGILVMPVENHLMRHTRVGENEWKSEKLMDVNFTLMIGQGDSDTSMIDMPLAQAKSLKELCRISIRQQLRNKTDSMNPNLLNSDNIDHRRRRRARAHEAIIRGERHKDRASKVQKGSSDYSKNMKSQETFPKTGGSCCCTQQNLETDSRQTIVSSGNADCVMTRSASRLLRTRGPTDQWSGASSSGTTSNIGPKKNSKPALSHDISKKRAHGTSGLESSDSECADMFYDSGQDDCARTRPFHERCERGSWTTFPRGSSATADAPSHDLTHTTAAMDWRDRSWRELSTSSHFSSSGESGEWSEIEEYERWCVNHVRQVRLFSPRLLRINYDFPPQRDLMLFSSESSLSNDSDSYVDDEQSSMESWNSFSYDNDDDRIDSSEVSVSSSPNGAVELSTFLNEYVSDSYSDSNSNENSGDKYVTRKDPQGSRSEASGGNRSGQSNDTPSNDQEPVASRLRSKRAIPETRASSSSKNPNQLRPKPGCSNGSTKDLSRNSSHLKLGCAKHTSKSQQSFHRRHCQHYHCHYKAQFQTNPDQAPSSPTQVADRGTEMEVGSTHLASLANTSLASSSVATSLSNVAPRSRQIVPKRLVIATSIGTTFSIATSSANWSCESMIPHRVTGRLGSRCQNFRRIHASSQASNSALPSIQQEPMRHKRKRGSSSSESSEAPSNTTSPNRRICRHSIAGTRTRGSCNCSIIPTSPSPSHLPVCIASISDSASGCNDRPLAGGMPTKKASDNNLNLLGSTLVQLPIQTHDNPGRPQRGNNSIQSVVDTAQSSELRCSNNTSSTRLSSNPVRSLTSASATSASQKPCTSEGSDYLKRPPTQAAQRLPCRCPCSKHNHNHHHHRHHHHRHQHHHHHHRHNHNNAYLCRNHRQHRQSQQSSEHQEEVSFCSQQADNAPREKRLKRSQKRRRENECEKYHNHMSSYIRLLPLPKVLLTYLNFDRVL